jgi:cell division protein FtsI (penicillin-binding protein 3)
VASIWADPVRLMDDPAVIPALAAALELAPDKLATRLSQSAQKGRRFVYLRRRVEPPVADAVAALIDARKLTGLGMETEYRRYYPGGEMFGQVVGFTNVDDEGQEGIELIENDRLRAIPGRRRVIQDGSSTTVEEVEQLRPPRHGRDVVLSIDRRLQFLAYRELKAAVQEHRAVGASAVLLDVSTGEVLALVNQPSFNPNTPRREGPAARRNRALTDVFEPGSTMKPLVVAAALEAGVVQPGTRINTNPGVLRVGRNRVRDIHNYGVLDATAVITKSSNVGVVKIAQRIQREQLWQLFSDLGFGKATGVGFPGEVNGRLRHFSDWSAFEYATHAFGYGLSVNTMQLAQAYSVLAADGLRRPVTLYRVEGPGPAEPVLSEDTAREVRAMMETVVSDRGTARRAKIPGYRVAGKTGTAKKASGRGYAPGRYQAVFAGMAPASRPRFVMVVMVDEPRGRSYYGGTVAAPTFAKVMQAALRLYNVPPDAAAEQMMLAGGRD